MRNGRSADETGRALMNPFERLREIVQAFGLSGAEDSCRWFDASNPVCRDAEQMLRAGRAAEAEEIFRRVLGEPQYAALARKQRPRILLALASAQIRQEKFDAARESASEARSLLGDGRHKASPEYADCCRILGQAARGLGEQEEALRHFLEGIVACEQQKPLKAAELVGRRLETAALLREMERFADAEKQAREAVQLAGERLPRQKEEGDALIEWAQCLAACEHFEEAREAGERAVEIHRASCGEQSGEVAEDYEKLGQICQKQQDLQSAVAYLEKALGVRDRQVGGDTSQLALLLVALADLYTLLGRLAPALELLQQAVGKLGPSKDANLADALEKLGAMYVRTGRYEDAADCYRRACDVWAVSPEAYADRLAANYRVLEDLQPYLPVRAAPARTEAPDPGTPVLLEHSPAATPMSMAGPVSPPASVFGMVPEPAGSDLTPSVPSPVVSAGHSEHLAGPLLAATVPVRPAGTAPPSPPQAAAVLPAEAAVGSPVQRSAVLAPPAGIAAGDPAAANPSPPGQAVAPAHEGQKFQGWEELEFEPLTVHPSRRSAQSRGLPLSG
jgi:tetratricopeptide (TPR) repeat protein